MKILVTTGGTRIPIDDVRYIGNMSSGRFGSEIANEFLKLGTNVKCLHSKYGTNPRELSNPLSGTYESFPYINFEDYKIQAINQAKGQDVIISAAAVSDYTFDKLNGKISSDGDELIIKMTKAPKILPLLRVANPDATIVGFKLLVSPSVQDVYKAVRKVLNNGANYVVYNDLTELRKGNTTRLLFDRNLQFVEVADAKALAATLYDKWVTH